MSRICRNMGKIVETPIPRTRTWVEAAAPQTHSRTSERRGYEADKERQVKRERKEAYPYGKEKNLEQHHRHITCNGGAGRKRVRLVSHLRYASQVIQYDPNYQCPGDYPPFKDSQGNTVTLAHSHEPYMQKYGKIRGNPDSTN